MGAIVCFIIITSFSAHIRTILLPLVKWSIPLEVLHSYFAYIINICVLLVNPIMSCYIFYFTFWFHSIPFVSVHVSFLLKITLSISIFFQLLLNSLIFIMKKHPRNCPGFSRVLFRLLGQLKIKEQSHNPVLPSCKPLKHLS